MWQQVFVKHLMVHIVVRCVCGLGLETSSVMFQTLHVIVFANTGLFVKLFGGICVVFMCMQMLYG